MRCEMEQNQRGNSSNLFAVNVSGLPKIVQSKCNCGEDLIKHLYISYEIFDMENRQ